MSASEVGLRLRSDVAVHQRPEGALRLLDHVTGFEIELEGEFAVLPLQLDEAELASALSGLGLLDEGLSVEEIRSRQFPHAAANAKADTLAKVRGLLAYATEHVRYYRERASIYDPARIENLDDLRALPLLRKIDLRREYPDGIVSEEVDVRAGMDAGTLSFATTSGTTGERLQVVADLRLPTLPPAFFRVFGIERTLETPRLAVFTSPTCMGTECHLGQLSLEERLRQEHTLFLNSATDLFSMGRELIENVVDELVRFRPTFLMANPIYLHWLLRRADEFAIRIPAIPVVLSSYQYLTRASRRVIHERLGAQVIPFYAASDLAGSRAAIGCRLGKVHVRSDHAHLELLTAADRAAGEALGAIAVTTVANRVLPLVRYLVGDVGRWDTEPCTCELAEWPCIELHGRAKDMIRIRGKWISTRQIDEVIGDDAGVDFYAVTQTGEDTLGVRAIPSPGAGDDVTRTLEARLRDGLGAATVTVRAVSRLDPEPSLKFRASHSEAFEPPEFP